MIKIKEIELVGIAVAAEIWFKKQNEISKMFIKEQKAAEELKNKLYKAQWDENAELYIDELPF